MINLTSPRMKEAEKASQTYFHGVREMYHLLIVDDEKTTRDSLRTVLPWNDLGIGAVTLAKNGVEALELAREVNPQIVLTDIRMPKMDGIQLAQQLRSLFPECKIIFLSGYADKEYLKSAISLKAVSYIEKPLNPDEIAAVIRETVALCDRESQQHQAIAKLQDHVAGSQSLVRQEITLELIKETPDIPGLIAKYGELPLRVQTDGGFTPIHVAFHWRPDLENARIYQLKQEILQTLTEERRGDAQTAYMAGFDNDANLVLIASHLPGAPDEPAFPASRNAPLLLLESLQKISRDCFDIAVGVGSTAAGIADLPQSYQAAVLAAHRQFYLGSNQIFYDCDSCPSAPLEIDRNLFAAFKEDLRKEDYDAALGVVGDLTRAVATCRDRDINRVKNIFFHLLLVIFEAALERGLINPLRDRQQTYLWNEIAAQRSLSGLSQYVILSVQNIFGRAGEVDAAGRKILEIKRFIGEHFHDKELSIQAVGAHVYLSPTYLCAFFKKSTGKTINEFITETRIEKAKELLKDDRIKLYEVATGVGWRDVNYFSTLFKRRLGCTPSEYREKNGR